MYKTILTNLPAQSCTSQSFIQLIQQRCPTNVSRFYLSILVGSTSRQLFVILVTLLSTFPLKLQSHTSSGPLKEKINLQSLLSTRLPSFHIRTQYRSALQQTFRHYYTFFVLALNPFSPKIAKQTVTKIMPYTLPRRDK